MQETIQVYIVICLCQDAGSDCDIHKIVATESDAYKIAYEEQKQWIQTFIVDTKSTEKKLLDADTFDSNHVWCKEDLDKLKAAYEEELEELYYEYQEWIVHSHDLDLNELSLLRIEV